MLNSTIDITEREIPMQSWKTTISKRILTLILSVTGIFAYSPADAQCICYCTNNNQPKNFSECYTRPNGSLGCRPSRCRGGVTGEQSTETTSLLFYSNPDSTSTTVSFHIGETENISIKIFDIEGKLVTLLADASFEEGSYEIIWDATAVHSGMYYLRFETSNYSENRKLIVMK